MSQNIGFERELFSITTLIGTHVIHDGSVVVHNATGFYYNEMTPTVPTKKGPQWHRIDKYWLITNRHVVLPKVNGVECVPISFTFYLRRSSGNNIEWEPINIDKDKLLKILRLHPDPRVDVAAIDVSELIRDCIKNELAATPGQCNLLVPTTLSATNLPTNQPIQIDVTSDIIVASYPKGFHDHVNKFPIVKSGIVASAWGYNFRGLPMFEIDAQLFPGSSGGLVLSKPTQITMIDGKLHYSTKKEFVFLGIYSGEYKWDDTIEVDGKEVTIKKSFGLGNVWYSYLVPQIIKNGVSYSS